MPTLRFEPVTSYRGLVFPPLDKSQIVIRDKLYINCISYLPDNIPQTLFRGRKIGPKKITNVLSLNQTFTQVRV